jgi:hypothetical protein
MPLRYPSVFLKPFALLKKAFSNLYLLMFLNGFLLASLFYFRMQSSYENKLFASVKASIDKTIDPDDTHDSIAVKAMQACHYLMSNRANTFSGFGPLSTETGLFHSASEDLMTTRGACGSYALVLTRLLDTYGYPVRIAQMKAGGIFAAHNVVEVKAGPSWIVLDPTYNVSFTRPDARLASFADVRQNWNYYASQVPKGYDLSYRYDDVRYTNWGKIPVLLPAIKALLNLTLGPQRTNVISLRTWFLKVYTVYFYGILLFYLPVVLLTFRRLIQVKVFPDQDIPFTLNNLIKYLRLHFRGSSYIH